ncbi:hypothetical protein ASF18_12235 [Methylobacterium sp. Leaf89]|nr:hypothetical protein ASF18_12235 [Methylobacterium sp. Leaf89]
MWNSCGLAVALARIIGETGSELGIGEGRTERRDAVPDGVVQEDAPARDAAVPLGRDESGLALHDRRVGRPGGE